MSSRLRRQWPGVFVLAGALLATKPLLVQAAGSFAEAGHEIGVSATNYKYTEPSIMSLKATKLGIDYAGTHTLSESRFVRAEARYATGKADYSGSGTKNGVPDYYYELRALIGQSYAVGDNLLSPYLGVGYRYLFNDLRGLTSTNKQGYRRESTYLALPIGVAYRSRLAGQAELVSTAEFDYLLRGRQKSERADAGDQNVTNEQRHGYGLRLSVMYQTDQWSVGPFVNVWRIDQSDVVSGVIVSGVVSSIIEPKNNTVEAGIRAAYRFQ